MCPVGFSMAETANGVRCTGERERDIPMGVGFPVVSAPQTWPFPVSPQTSMSAGARPARGRA